MALIPNELKEELQSFILTANQKTVEDINIAIDNFCGKFESIVYAAIKSITITMPPGSIIVEGSSVTQTNVEPIILEGVIS